MWRKCVDFFKTKSGKTVAIIALFIFGMALVYYFRNAPDNTPIPDAEIEVAKKDEVVIRDKGEVFNDKLLSQENKKSPQQHLQTKKRTTRNITRNRLPVRRTQPTFTKEPLEQQPEVLPLNLYTEPPGRVQQVSDNYAPYGAMLECQLVNSLDSSSLMTPIIAIVTKDWYHNHKVIIPAGTLVYGSAAKSAMRDRIGASSRWVLVWRTLDENNGKELKITGLALNKEKIAGTSQEWSQWGILDGSAGIRGEVIQSTDMAELMAIAAAFLAGAGEGLTSQDIVVGGSSTIITNNDNDRAANVIGQGLSQAAKLYAKIMMEQVSTQGYFVRVPAGKEFYIFVPQTIDLDDAMIGGVSLRKTNR